MGSIQEVNQKLGQKYGWSVVYSNDESSGSWRLDIVTGLGQPTKTFVFPSDHQVVPDCGTSTCSGKACVSKLALEGLKSEIDYQESLPIQVLSEVFGSTVLSRLELLDSRDPTTWIRFWNHPPTAVGIDTEGNNISPPVLVQISTSEYCILETPQTSLSADLTRLLHDDSITKVFCDNQDHKDKKSLGLIVPKNSGRNELVQVPVSSTYTTNPSVLDLEILCKQHLGPTSNPRGIGKLVSLMMPELQVRIEKPRTSTNGRKGRYANVKRFAMIEQGRARRLQSVNELLLEEQQYAALDAWCVLAVYERLKNLESKE